MRCVWAVPVVVVVVEGLPVITHMPYDAQLFLLTRTPNSCHQCGKVGVSRYAVVLKSTGRPAGFCSADCLNACAGFVMARDLPECQTTAAT